MSIQVSDYGFKFVLECFRQFQGQGIFYLLFAAACGYLWLTRKDARWKQWALWYFAALFLTVYNPFLITYAIDRLGLDDEYYRFIWLLPFTPVIAWGAVSLVSRLKKWWARWVLTAILAVLIAIPGKSILAKPLQLAHNAYKVPTDLIQICDWLHEKEGEHPRVALEFELAVLINQYDPSIIPAMQYSDYSYIEYLLTTGQIVEMPPDAEFASRIYRVMVRNERLEGLTYERGLDSLDILYVVLDKSSSMLDYHMEHGLGIVLETDNYWLLKLTGPVN